MKKTILLALAICASTAIYAQVGINNTNPKATMDITASTTNGTKPEGLIVPRLTGSQIRSADGQYGMDQKGLIIFATSADPSPYGKTVNITTAGYYYFDGYIWQKVLSSNTLSWINDAAISGVKLGTRSDGISPRTSGTEFVALDNGNVGIGTNNPSVLLDTRRNGTSDQIGVGKTLGANLTPSTASKAGEGAITYSSASGGTLVYSNGNNWNTLSSTVQKSVVVAKLPTGTFNFVNMAPGVANVTGWNVSVDVNNNFTASTGTFIAPRSGNYSISSSLLPIFTTNNSGAFETHILVNNTSVAVGIQSGITGRTAYTGATVSTVVKVNAGDIIRIGYYQDLGTNRNNHKDNFNTLSIVEL